jgi:cyanate permease
MAESKARSRHRIVMLVFPFLIAFSLHLLLFATAPMVTVIMEEMELSHAQFGFLFSVAMISLILLRVPWGLMADRMGYLRVLRVALPIAAASAFARAFSPDYLTLLLSQLCLGVGLAAVMPCLSLLVQSWSRQTAGLSTGVYVSGFAAGNATALGLTPSLLEMVGWRHVLMMYAGLGAVVCGLWWALAKGGDQRSSELHVKDFGGLLKDSYVWVLAFFMIGAMGSYDTLATWMPKVLAMKELNTALSSLLPLGFFLAGPIVGLASDKLRNRKTVVALLGCIAAASIIGINYAPFPLLLLCLLLSGFAPIGVLTIALAVPVEDERLSHSAGAVVGLVSALGNIGPLAMPVVFGFLMDVTGTFRASVLSVAALAGVTFILGSRASR